MEVTIRSPLIQEKLDRVINEFHYLCDKSNVDLTDYNNPEIECNVGEARGKGVEWFASEEYLRERMLPRWNEHIGYPKTYRIFPVERLAGRREDDPEWMKYWNWGRYELPPEIGTASSALFVHYPVDGLTGWHTNWNANAYQILFTWSETGDGFFRYYDKQKDEVVTVEDKPGWQCRWYYFGRKDEPDHHCWHTCYTRCRRMTLAFKFSNNGLDYDEDAMARMLRDELVNEIESP